MAEVATWPLRWPEPAELAWKCCLALERFHGRGLAGRPLDHVPGLEGNLGLAAGSGL